MSEPSGGAPRANHIPRHRGDPAPTGFDGLRGEGLRLVQALAGDTWTDYNLHDPGVTILEQLCYALTDLDYRTDFSVADLLTGEDGRIDYAGLGLPPPAAVLPARPSTADDYRGALLDTITALANVWVRADAEGGAGLYHVAVKLAGETADDASRAEVLARVRDVYRANRSLCEDVETITVVTPLRILFSGDLEVGGARPPADILAEVLEVCSRAVSAGVAFRSFEQALADGVALEDILQPLHTRHGVLRPEDLARADREELFVGDLIARVRAIEGVRHVRHLALARDGGEPTTGALRWDARTEAPVLHVPDDDAAVSGIRITRGGIDVRVSAREVLARLRDLRGIDRSRAFGRQDIQALRPLPKGTVREFGRYTSIQTHFPAIYGIDERGLPEDVPALRKAQAHQLKGYLTLFDQLLANGAEQLRHLPDLYSASGAGARTYWWQTLDERAVPGLRALQARGVPVDDAHGVAANGVDAHVDRRSRVLDHLLALHGEVLPQNTLRQFLPYDDPEQRDVRLVENKAAFLQGILKAARDRGAGFDYSRDPWAGETNVSGLQWRSTVLLGMEPVRPRSLTASLRALRVTLVPDDDDGRAPHGGPMLTRSSALKSFRRVAPAPEPGPVSIDELRQVHRLRLGRDGGLSPTLLRDGVDPARYLVGQVPGRAEHLVVFLPEGDDRGWVLASHASADAAVRAVHRLRRFLIEASLASEGMHVIEHVLLRPAGDEVEAWALRRLPPSFFALRATVVLPAWTARTAQAAFRRFAEETVGLNAPAHVRTDCLWLDFAAMTEFESALAAWHEARVAACASEREPGTPAHRRDRVALDVASLALADALRRHAAAEGAAA